MNPHRLKAYIYLLIVVVIWGIAGVVIKLTLSALPWDIFILYRFMISSAIILPFISKRIIRSFKNPKLFFLSILYAFVNTTLGLSLLFAGTARTSLVSMSLLSLFGPILVILGGYFILKDRITWIEKMGISITFLGSLLIIIEPLLKFNGVQGELSGNLLILGYLVTSAIGSILLKQLLRDGVGAAVLANTSFIVGFISLIPVVLINHSFTQVVSIIRNLSLPYQLGVWYMAIFSGTLAYTLSNKAQKTIEVSEQAVFGYLYPALSAVLAVWLLKEPMTPLSYFGAGVTAVGIIVAEVKRRRRTSGR